MYCSVEAKEPSYGHETQWVGLTSRVWDEAAARLSDKKDDFKIVDDEFVQRLILQGSSFFLGKISLFLLVWSTFCCHTGEPISDRK